MRTTCELVSGMVLPSIRAWIAREAIKKFKMKQKDVANCLGVTNSAVSQYMKEKRADIGVGKKELKQIKPLITEIANKMASKQLTDFEMMKLMCRICFSLRASLILCKLHMQLEPKLKKINCTICNELLKDYRKVRWDRI
jgi:predicted transcriptional regulator